MRFDCRGIKCSAKNKQVSESSSGYRIAKCTSVPPQFWRELFCTQNNCATDNFIVQFIPVALRIFSYPIKSLPFFVRPPHIIADCWYVVGGSQVLVIIFR